MSSGTQLESSPEGLRHLTFKMFGVLDSSWRGRSSLKVRFSQAPWEVSRESRVLQLQEQNPHGTLELNQLYPPAPVLPGQLTEGEQYSCLDPCQFPLGWSLTSLSTYVSSIIFNPRKVPERLKNQLAPHHPFSPRPQPMVLLTPGLAEKLLGATEMWLKLQSSALIKI